MTKGVSFIRFIRIFNASVFLVLVGLVLTASAASAQPKGLGLEFQVNGYGGDSQESPELAAGPDGGFVVVWQSYGSEGDDDSGWSVQMQRFDAGAAPLGDQYQVNTYTTNNQPFPTVAADADGRFVVSWSSFGSPGDDSRYSIQARRFDAFGEAFGPDFQLNAYTTNNQVVPAMAMTPDGDFVVVWHSEDSTGNDTDGSSIQARRFDASGEPLGPEFQVNTYTKGYQFFPSVDVTPGGGFVVVWHSEGSDHGSTAASCENTLSCRDTSSWSVLGQRFNALGVPVGDEIQVNAFTTGQQTLPVVKTKPEGGFVVAWQSYGSFANDARGFSVQARHFTSAGAPIGPEFQVNSEIPNHQRTPALAVGPEGDFVVVWQSEQVLVNESPQYDLRGRYFKSSGEPLGGELRINAWTAGQQERPAVMLGADGHFVVAWESYGSFDGSDQDRRSIQARRFNTRSATMNGVLGDPPAYAFETPRAGQYRFALSWPGAAGLGLELSCLEDGVSRVVGRGGAVGDRLALLDVGLPADRDCRVSVEPGNPPPPAGSAFALNLHSSGLLGSGLEPPATAAVPASPRPLQLDRTELQQIRGGEPQTFEFGVGQAGELKVTTMWNRADTALTAALACRPQGSQSFLRWATSTPLAERVLRLDAEVPGGSTCRLTFAADRTAAYAVHLAHYLPRETTLGTLMEGGTSTQSFRAEATGQQQLVLTWDDPAQELDLALECGDELVARASSERDRFRTLDTALAAGRPCTATILHTGGSGPVAFRLHRRASASADAAASTAPAPLPRPQAEPAPGQLKTTVLRQIRPDAPQAFDLDVFDPGPVRITAMWNRRTTQLEATMICVNPRLSPAIGTFPWAASRPGASRVLRLDTEVPQGFKCRVVFTSDETAAYAVHFALYGQGDMAPED